MKSKNSPEKYILYRKEQVIQTLRLLTKNNCLVNVTFGFENYSFLTVLIDVLTDKDIVILDYGPSEVINKKLLDHDQKVIFTSEFNGIRARFSAEQVTQAKLDGNTVFVVPIPDSMLWLQRREFYRIKVPLKEPVRCRITLADDKTTELNLCDISITGLALMDPDGNSDLPFEIGTVIPDSQLLLPEYSAAIDLRICNRTPISTNEATKKYRIGCSFVSPTSVFQSNILKFMQSIERQMIHLNH